MSFPLLLRIVKRLVNDCLQRNFLYSNENASREQFPKFPIRPSNDFLASVFCQTMSANHLFFSRLSLCRGCDGILSRNEVGGKHEEENLKSFYVNRKKNVETKTTKIARGSSAISGYNSLLILHIKTCAIKF